MVTSELMLSQNIPNTEVRDIFSQPHAWYVWVILILPPLIVFLITLAICVKKYCEVNEIASKVFGSTLITFMVSMILAMNAEELRIESLDSIGIFFEHSHAWYVWFTLFFIPLVALLTCLYYRNEIYKYFWLNTSMSENSAKITSVCLIFVIVVFVFCGACLISKKVDNFSKQSALDELPMSIGKLLIEADSKVSKLEKFHEKLRSRLELLDERRLEFIEKNMESALKRADLFKSQLSQQLIDINSSISSLKEQIATIRLQAEFGKTPEAEADNTLRASLKSADEMLQRYQDELNKAQ